MRKVLYNGKGYSVVEIDGEMKVCWAEGHEGTIVYHDISEDLFERLKKSEADAYHVMLEVQHRDRITMDLQTLNKMRMAIQENRVDDFKQLANANKDTFDVNAPWATFLHYAAAYGSYGIAEYLIECGVNVNKRGGFRNSNALPYAAFGGHLDVVKLLYENGCKINTDYNLENPLFTAKSEGHLDVLKYLVDREFDYDSFGERLYAETREVMKKYSNQDDIYAFSIKYEPEFTSFISILANSYSYLNECSQKGSFSLNDYKYCEEDWGIWEDLKDLSDELASYYDLVDKWCGEDDDLYEEVYEEHKKRIIDVCINVMLKIKQSEEFSFYSKLNLNVFVREGMSADEELEIFKKLNDEQSVKEFEKFMGKA